MNTCLRAAAVLGLLTVPALAQHLGPGVPEGVRVREGYELTVAAELKQTARFMARAPDGTLYVSDPRTGKVGSYRDTDGDGTFEFLNWFVEGQVLVHGLSYDTESFEGQGWLWYATSGAVMRGRDTDGDGKADETVTVLAPGSLPSQGGHWWRSLLIHDGRIYTGIGESANASDERDTERQKIFTFKTDGSDKRLFSSGIRNTEKLVVRPGTDEIWGMDHGSDNYGQAAGERGPRNIPITSNNPPGEMNHYVANAFYGHPFLCGMNLPRLEFLGRKDIDLVDLASKTTVPAWCTPAHWAPNAMCFYDADQFPGHRGDAFVAFHGSWNRQPPAGYQVARVLFEDGTPYGQLSYVRFLTDDLKVLGRPVDVLVEPDGSLLISDDHGNKIYRLRYVGGGDARP